MGEVVNLRHARKAKAREDKEAAAAANRLKHGRNAAERQADAADQQRRDHLLDDAKLED